MLHSDTLNKIAPDLRKAQQEIEHAPKVATGQVGKMKYKYADLGAVLDATEPVLNKYNISLLQPSRETSSGATVQTTLLHDSGEWISDAGFHCPTTGQGAQGVGAAATYARRYGLAALLGIAQQDDDGHSNSQPITPMTSAPVREGVTRPAARSDLSQLKDRISELPDAARNDIRNMLKDNRIAWSSMTTDQLAIVTDYVTDVENDANANNEAAS